MAGLFELQLPSQSRSRRSQDVPEPRLSTSNGVRSSSPPPEITAREIVSQVVAKRDAAAAAPTSTSIFPWKRKATTAQGSPRRSSDGSPRNSADTGRSISQSPDRQRKYADRLSPRRVAAPASPSSPSSPRVSSSIDFTITPSSPNPAGASSNISQETGHAHAASTLAHAGLGIGLPPVAFPAKSSRISSSPAPKTNSTKRTKSARPGTAHGHEGPSTSTSFKVEQIRRVKSFNKEERVQDASAPASNSLLGNNLDKGGDVLVFTRDTPSSAAPHVRSMPEWSIRDTEGKGKGKESDSSVEIHPPNVDSSAALPRGRRPTSPSPLPSGDRERSATRRTSWWPGRRRIDSSPVNPPPPLPPPPIPQRSQARPSSASGRPTPSLPTFRPFSPLMSEFPISESPRASDTTFQDRDISRQRGLDDAILGTAEGGSPIRRRHSLNNRTGGTHSYVTPISSQTSSPPSQVYSQSHRYSWSMSLSSSLEHSASTQASPSAPSLVSATDAHHHSKPQTMEAAIKSTRRRSMTVNSPPLSPTRETTPLLLRQPVNRSPSSMSPPDPFLTGWGMASGTRTSVENPDTSTLGVIPIEVDRTPSTSSGSTSSLSHSATVPRSPRQRAGTTPPSRGIAASSTSTSLPPPSSSNRLLRRLSSTIFSSSSTPVASNLESSQPALNSTASLSGGLHSGAGTSSPETSNASSPRWSRENLPAGESRTSVEMTKPKPAKPPARTHNETPEEYLGKLIKAVSKAEVAHVLAAHGDEFHAQALRLYINRFNFLDDPLDVALRKLLMDLGLPRETQQIDRVMEAFAKQYARSNPGLFENDDHPYILAFSLIMLHTDAFNKSNKNKMTKADYVKNARLPGVPPEILECFFDNIVFAPFIFIEDPMDSNAPKGYLPEGASRLSSINVPVLGGSGTPGNSGGPTILGKANKIDPYYLITQGLLGPLRAAVNSEIPWSNPFLFEGTDWPWDTRRLHLLFAIAQVIHFPGDIPPSPTIQSTNSSSLSSPARRKSIALPSLGVGHGPFMGSSPFSSDGLPPPPRPSLSRASGPGLIRITKVGVLGRKDDVLEGGRRSTSRKWREWTVVLTASQLLFFRDIAFASQLLGLPDTQDIPNSSPEMGLMNPDETVSLNDCVALFDGTYNKYVNTFRLLMPTGRQFLCQAPDERTLNDWISTINYACAFKTAGVSMRGLGISHKDVEMTGVAAAASHLQDLQETSSKASSPPTIHTYGSFDISRSPDVSPSRPQTSQTLTSSGRVGTGSKILRTFNGAQSQVDLELPVPSHLEGAQQLQATFDEVKAQLAAQGQQLRPSSAGRVRTLSMGARPTVKTPPRPATTGGSSQSDDMQHSTSRNDIIRSCIDNWDSKISRTQHELDRELRVARNLAILTPFQRATRDRIQMAVAQLAKRVKTMRFELTRLTCYRFVLLSDLADEERHLEQAKRDALKAATQKLSITEEPSSQTIYRQMTDRSSSHQRSQASATESFYSATDGIDGSGNVSTPLSMLSEDDISDFPFLAKIRTSISRDNNATNVRSPPNHSLSDTIPSPIDYGHERFYTAAETPEEIAEAWHETRAAKRVSLVRLPSDVKLSSAYVRQARKLEDGIRQRESGQLTTTSPQENVAPQQH